MLDLGIAEIIQLTIDHHRAQQVVERIAAQGHGSGRPLGALMEPASFHLSPTKVLEQGDGPIRSRQGAGLGQTLLKTTAGFAAQPHTAG